jgi:hypothetical protein
MTSEVRPWDWTTWQPLLSYAYQNFLSSRIRRKPCRQALICAPSVLDNAVALETRPSSEPCLVQG